MQAPPNPKDPQKPSPKPPPIREMVGATTAPFTLGKGQTQISFEVHAPTGPALVQTDGTTRRVFLKVENIRSKMAAPSFEIYLNLPPGEQPQKRPDLRVGTLSTFGLLETSRASEHHAGNGLTYTEEITKLFLRLIASRDWDSRNLRVAFVPSNWEYPLEVQVGRVSLMFE